MADDPKVTIDVTQLDLAKVAASTLPLNLLRKMNHREWLSQFAMTLEAPVKGLAGKPVMMTPFKQGAINRLRMASQYIEALEAENAALQRDLDKALAALDHEVKQNNRREGTDDTTEG